MASDYAKEFWTEQEKYHDLAQTFEENIVVNYPDRVTSRRMCPCLEYFEWCGHPLEGKVEYYDYNGPRVTHI